MKKEIRVAELRAAQTAGENDGQFVEGYALVFDSPTVLWEYDGIKYSEVIARGALDGADLSDVPFKYNHSDNVMVMARTRNKTLQLVTDEKGLRVRADLAKTTTGSDLYKLIQRGDIDKMSMAMVVTEDSYDRETHTRTVLKIKRLYDVAAVDLPAYDQTSISVRSYFDTQCETEERIKREFEARKKRLIIATYL